MSGQRNQMRIQRIVYGRDGIGLKEGEVCYIATTGSNSERQAGYLEIGPWKLNRTSDHREWPEYNALKLSGSRGKDGPIKAR